MKSVIRLLILLLGLSLLASLVYPAKAAAPENEATPAPAGVVRVVLFYSPTCGHCHYVIQEILPPLVEQYGERLEIIGVNVTAPAGQILYQAAIARYQLPEEQQGVPTLVIGETVLVGSQEIPERLPGLIEAGLAAGGFDWPDIPGLAQALAAELETPAPAPEPAPASPTPTASATPAPTVLPPSPTTLPTEPPAATVLPPGPTALPTEPPTATPVPARAEASRQLEAEPVYLAYFFDPSCLECARVSAELVHLQARYPQLVVQKYELPQAAALNEAMCEKYGLPEEYHLLAPIIFIGEECLLPAEIELDRLQALIENPAVTNAPPPWANLAREEEAATARIVERFSQFSLLAVAGAGLLDGVNPCAFTTLIFFVSYLALVGRKGRDILLVGAAFTLAVFLTYLLMGLGLAEIIRQVSSFRLIGRLIYSLTALFCLGLALLSLLDYFKIRQGRLSEISLQLPKGLKQRIHQTIRTHSRMRGYVGAAFGAGVLVSLFELACTGQVYLPTIVFVTGVAELRLEALAYLVLYNLMFVVPLLLVFGLAYWGTSSRQLTAFFQARAGTVKLLTALLFGALGLWLGYMAWLISA